VPTQPPIQWVPGALSLRVKRPERETDLSSSSSVEDKNAWSCTFTSSIRLHGVVLSWSTGNRMWCVDMSVSLAVLYAPVSKSVSFYEKYEEIKLMWLRCAPFIWIPLNDLTVIDRSTLGSRVRIPIGLWLYTALFVLCLAFPPANGSCCISRLQTVDCEVATLTVFRLSGPFCTRLSGLDVGTNKVHGAESFLRS
jgi:hypothetical protein